MAFKDLHKLKKVVVVEKEFIEVPHLVVGKDIFAVSIYKKLQAKYGNENVRLLSEDTILKSDLLPKGPSSLRGQSNQKIIKDLYPVSIIFEATEASLFYKDMAWKSFKGRSKPEVLKFDEGFFTTSRLDINPEVIFPELQNADSFLQEINNEAYQVRLKSIVRAETGFQVECLNGTEFKCEKLYFGQSPYQYLKYYLNKNELPDLFIEFCESTKTSSALFVKFAFDKPITDMKETLFIPLSYTHGWGHFIGEFSQNKNEQMIEFIHYLDEDQSSEEEVSKVIRLIKNSMEKIFDKFSKINLREYIVLEQEIGCLKIDDKLFMRAMESNKIIPNNLFLFGINGPIYPEQSAAGSFEYSSMLARGLLNYSKLLNKI